MAALSVLASCSTYSPPPPLPPPRMAAAPLPSIQRQRSFTIPRFDWPLAQGKLSSGFGLRRGAMHEGVDIAAPVGTPVMAAANGQVIFAGRMHGYGRIVIIQHADHYVTVYAHDSSNLVEPGQIVRRGQVIGYVGRSGHTTGANLHFEVRHNNVASNPMLYLPPIRTTSDTRLAGIGY
ncbi:MAG TPA: M23 family metallopeptidase [Candidatus Binataceae bacterium]|nr:M23 family metallopeptidase [Candidatus Binataceae bacterium]